MMAGGSNVQAILVNYPTLTAEDIAAALEYAARIIDEEKVIPHALAS